MIDTLALPQMETAAAVLVQVHFIDGLWAYEFFVKASQLKSASKNKCGRVKQKSLRADNRLVNPFLKSARNDLAMATVRCLE